jgi:hypothetical protein
VFAKQKKAKLLVNNYSHARAHTHTHINTHCERERERERERMCLGPSAWMQRETSLSFSLSRLDPNTFSFLASLAR